MHQDGGGVGAGGKKAAVAERDLAVVAGEDVEAEHGDGVDHHHRQFEHVIFAQAERQRRDQCDGHQRGDPPPGAGGQSGVAIAGKRFRSNDGDAFVHLHTRRTIAVPNKPFGRNTSTRMINANATVSLSWLAIR